MAGLTCDHASGPWGNLGHGTDEDWWVHADTTCKKPTAAWLLSHDKETDTMLNFFRGGAMDGLAYDTKALLQPAALSLPVVEYHWTPEYVIGPATGNRARVWVHRSIFTGLGDFKAVRDTAPEPPGDVAPANIDGTHVPGSYERRRKALGLSRGAMGEAAGISPSQVNRLEKSLTGLRPDTEAIVKRTLEALEQERNPT